LRGRSARKDSDKAKVREIRKARQVARAEAGVTKVAKPFALFCQEFKGNFAGLWRAQGFKAAGARWRELPDEERQVYVDRSRQLYAKRREDERDLGLVRRRTCKTEGGTAPVAGETATGPGEIATGPLPGRDGPAAAAENPGEAVVPAIRMVCGDYSWDASGEALLGEGSYGKVFRARRLCYADVAAKVYHCPSDAGIEWGCLQKCSGRLGPRGPFLDVLEHSQSGALGVVFMELCDTSLSDLFRRGGAIQAMTVPRLVFYQIRNALIFAHSNGVAHLDVKPANVLWVERERRAVLADFSVAECAFDASSRPRSSDQPPNSLNYRPPEHLGIVAQKEYLVQYESDAWAFGCLLWELGVWEADPTARPPKMFPGERPIVVRETILKFFRTAMPPVAAGWFAAPVKRYCAELLGRRVLETRFFKDDLDMHLVV